MSQYQSPEYPDGPAAPTGYEEVRQNERNVVLDRHLISRGISWWALWSTVALLLAILYRLIDLRGFALTPSEGDLTFQGWSVYKGEGAFGINGVPNISPVVQLAEAFLFFIAGTNDVIARLAPAAFGIGAICLIFLLRPVSHRGTILGLMITLGLSPSLVYFSRTVDPAIFIVFFGLLLAVAVARAGSALYDTRLLIWSGVTGIAIAGMIASGPTGITMGLAGLLAITGTAMTHSTTGQRTPDAIAVGARRIASTPGALLLALGTALLTLLILFTRLFSDIDAIVGVVDTFQEWGRIVGTRPTTTPVQFFFWATLLYEIVSVVLMAVALLSAPTPGDRDARPVLHPSTFGIWFGLALIFQSLSSGREPDQLVLVSLPLTIGAGIGLGYVLERVERYRLLSTIAWLVPATVFGLLIGVIAVLMTVARSNDPSTTGGSGSAQAQILIILLLVIVPLSVILAREWTQQGRGARVGWSAMLVLIVLLSLFGVRNTSMLSFQRSDQGTEMLARNTSTAGVVAFVDQVKRLSHDLSVDNPTVVDPTARFGLTISVSPEIADPYRWYFRQFPDVRITSAAGWSGSDVVIAPTSEGMAEAGYIVQSRAQFNRIPPAYEGMDVDDNLPYFWSPSKWYGGIRFLLFRDHIAQPPPMEIATGYTPELSNQINPSLGPFNLSDAPGRGSALGQFDTPVGIGATTDGDVIYVVDSVNQRIERFTGEGEFVGVWSVEQDPNLDFATAFDSGPTGLAVSNDDLIYVADTWNHRVVVIDRSGQFVREIGQNGGETDLQDSSDPNQQTGLFFGPRGVAVHDGEIYVTDTGNERVQVFASDGTFLRTFGGYGSEPGKLIEPVGIAVGPDNRVYVADSGNQRLSIFETDGTPVAQIPVPSWQGQPRWVNYLAFGPDGLLYMTSPTTGSVDVFDPGSSSIVLTTNGPADSPLEQPVGITVMRDGEVLVTDDMINDVVRFTPDIPSLPPPATPAASPATSPAQATPT